MGGTVIKMLKDKGKQQSYVKKKKIIIITKKEDIGKISTELG